MQAHVAPWKKEEVQRLVQILEAADVIALAKVEGIPAAQMAKMRSNLRDDAMIKVTKNTLLTLALKEASRKHAGLDQLADRIDGQTALIATRMNPFKLFKRLEQSKTKAPARGGEVAPADVAVQKGETPFKPGPIVGELQRAGIPAKIDQGKVMITADKVLVKAGDRIPQEVAQMLTRLEIFPLIVGMDLKAAYEAGTIFGTDVLAVDEAALLARLQLAATQGYALALETAWTTPDTIRLILGKAHREAVALALEAAYPEKGVVDLLLARAHGGMLAVAGRLSDEAKGDELKAALAGAAVAAAASAAPAAGPAEVKKEEKKEEEPTEEEAAAGLGSLFG